MMLGCSLEPSTTSSEQAGQCSRDRRGEVGQVDHAIEGPQVVDKRAPRWQDLEGVARGNEHLHMREGGRDSTKTRG